MENLPNYLNVFPIVDGFPRPDWTPIFYWIDNHCFGPQSQTKTHDDIVSNWLEQLSDCLETTHYVYETDDVMLLTALERNEALLLLRFIKKALDQIKKTFGPRIEENTFGSGIYLHFENSDEYWKYISHFYSDGQYAQNSGCFIGGEGIWHIALAPNDLASLQQTIAHELIHERLYHLGLPLWVEEGLAQLNEQNYFPDSHQYDPDVIKEYLAFFDSETIHDFWDGNGFSSEQKSQEACYFFAYCLVKKIINSYPSATEFILNANYVDAGQYASQFHLLKSLGEIASELLGPGDWEPKEKNQNSYSDW